MKDTTPLGVLRHFCVDKEVADFYPRALTAPCTITVNGRTRAIASDGAMALLSPASLVREMGALKPLPSPLAEPLVRLIEERDRRNDPWHTIRVDEAGQLPLSFRAWAGSVGRRPYRNNVDPCMVFGVRHNRRMLARAVTAIPKHAMAEWCSGYGPPLGGAVSETARPSFLRYSPRNVVGSFLFLLMPLAPWDGEGTDPALARTWPPETLTP